MEISTFENIFIIYFKHFSDFTSTAAVTIEIEGKNEKGGKKKKKKMTR